MRNSRTGGWAWLDAGTHAEIIQRVSLMLWFLCVVSLGMIYQRLLCTAGMPPDCGTIEYAEDQLKVVNTIILVRLQREAETRAVTTQLTRPKHAWAFPLWEPWHRSTKRRCCCFSWGRLDGINSLGGTFTWRTSASSHSLVTWARSTRTSTYATANAVLAVSVRSRTR